MTFTDLIVRIGLAASLAVSAASHAYLYVHGYQHIPTIGTAFLIQASVSFALALLILVGGPGWLRWAAAAVARRLSGGLRPVEDCRAFRLFRAGMGAVAATRQSACAAEVLTVAAVGGCLGQVACGRAEFHRRMPRRVAQG